ncbi:unnamed protein product [Rhizophagus irregularis]|nr:unnamed protein product [Rhizophagus irregularis]
MFSWNDESNKYGKLIRNMPPGFDLKILLPTKVDPMNEVTVNIDQGITKLFIKKSRFMLKIVNFFLISSTIITNLRYVNSGKLCLN